MEEVARTGRTVHLVVVATLTAAFGAGVPVLTHIHPALVHAAALVPVLYAALTLYWAAGLAAGAATVAGLALWSQVLHADGHFGNTGLTELAIMLAGWAAIGGIVGYVRSMAVQLRDANRRLQDREDTLWALNKQLTNELDKYEGDINQARTIQESLLPTEHPPIPGITWSVLFEPCEDVGGDIFGHFWLDRTRLALYLLDVSDHGLPAAMFSGALTRVIPAIALRTPDMSPAALATELNQDFPMSPITGQYFTLVCAFLDVERLTLTCTAAGHPGPVIAPHGGCPTLLEIPGPPIGFSADPGYEEIVIQLEQGDRVALYSDGIPEAYDKQQQCYGTDRLTNFVAAPQSLEMRMPALLAELQSFTADATQDDRTLLAFEVTDAAAAMASVRPHRGTGARHASPAPVSPT